MATIDMDKTFNKETICFYLVAAASSLAAIAAMCASAFWRATGGIAVGFALFLPAIVLACFAFSYPSPLNKVRCAFMLGNTLTLGAIFLALFIACDLAGARVVLQNAAGKFQPNAMGVVLTLYMGLGLLSAVVTAVRVIMQAFGKSMGDAERRLTVQSAPAVDTVQEVAPRQVDEKQVLAKADQEVRLNRTSIVPATPDGQASQRKSVSPQEVRAMRREEPAPAAPAAPVREEPKSEPEPQPDLAAIVQAIVQEPEPQPREEERVRSILEEPPIEEAADEVIYADGDDVDDEPVVEVEMARGEDVAPDDEMRTETVAHRPRRKETANDNLYTDFSYGDPTPRDDE